MIPQLRQFRHWGFTVNNWTEQDEAILEELGRGIPGNGIRYLGWGREICPNTGTPHLQGAIGLDDKKRKSELVTWFTQLGVLLRDRPNNAGVISGVFFKPAKNVQCNWHYAIKESRLGGTTFVFGTPPSAGRGARNDIALFQADVRAGASWDQLLEIHFGLIGRCRAACNEYFVRHMPKPDIEYHPLRNWQARLLEVLQGPVSKREVHFVVDTKGDTGKSWFCDYVENIRWETRDVLIVHHCKRDNLSLIMADRCRIQEPRIVFLDLSKSWKGQFNYDFLEELKNGRMVSGKYHSQMVRFKTPHLVVMMNQFPDMEKLSADRYVIHNLDNETAN